VSDSPNLDPLLGKVLEERYRVDELIARGGMATVYRGTDLRLGRTVALKVLGGVLANDPDFVERFTQEARATAALTHPNVVAVHDQGISAGFPFLVMEFVQGRTIREVMAQSGPFTSAHALEIISSVLAGLGSAHDAGFVHRDIKPENVLITNDGHIKVTDFGLARVISDTPVSDSTGAVLLGTMAYLSPEQVQQLAVDQRSDVYSCGILLYEMVTGLVPFTGSSPLEVAYQHVNSNVSSPSSVQPDVPPAVDHLVLAATRKLPIERIQSAREFRDAVIRAISAVPRAEALVAVLSIQASQVVSTPPTEVHREMQRPAPVQDSNPGINTTGVESTNERSKPRGKLAPLIMILALLVGGGAWYQYSGTYEVVQQVDVPPIVGTLITDATTTLTALGLTTKTIQEDFDASFAGTILSTDPVPGTSVPKGTVINVVLSKGPVLIDVPNVVGMNIETATSTLQAAGFQVEAVNKISVTILNKVYSQKPAAGTKAPKGSVITIEIV
jgi:serine/threonine-protein kinase